MDTLRGTGKTFVINAIHKFLKMKGINFIAVATTAIAAQLFRKVMTAHLTVLVSNSRNRQSIFHIEASSGEASKLEGVNLTIWDEVVMCMRYKIETVHKTLKDLMCIN